MLYSATIQAQDLPAPGHDPEIQPRPIHTLRVRAIACSKLLIVTASAFFFAPLHQGPKAMKKKRKNLGKGRSGYKNSHPGRSPNGVVKSIVFNKQKSVLGRILTVTLKARAPRWGKKEERKWKIGGTRQKFIGRLKAVKGGRFSTEIRVRIFRHLSKSSGSESACMSTSGSPFNRTPCLLT
jgi:hypothetical protein